VAQFLRLDASSPWRKLVGIGGIGTGIFFAFDDPHTLGRNESRPARLLDVRDYCKLHIVIHYMAKLLGAQKSGSPFHIIPIGKVGNDARGRQLLKEMVEAGIDTSRVWMTEEKPTLFSVCFQYPDGSGGNITTSNSAAAALCERDLDAVADILDSEAKQAIVLVLPEVPLEVRRHFLDLATRADTFRAGSFVSAEIAAARESGFFDLLDLVSLNESEAVELVGAPFSADAPEPFLQRCQDFIGTSNPNLRMIVSAGALGAWALMSELLDYCPAPKVCVASSAGAGDALLAGVLAAMAAGVPFLRPRASEQRPSNGPLETALDLSVLLASYTCLSLHTIHPDASLSNLVEFARSLDLTLGSGLQQFFTES